MTKVEDLNFYGVTFRMGVEDEKGTPDEISMPKIKRIVVYNGFVTKIFWKDGSDTTVKLNAHDNYDLEKAVAIAIAKKFYGSYENMNRSISRVKYVDNK